MFQSLFQCCGTAHGKDLFIAAHKQLQAKKTVKSIHLLFVLASRLLIVRCPFREEHLAVCRKFFLYTCHFGEDVPSRHIMSPPCGGYWWLLVLAWDKWSAQMVHQCTKVYGIWAKMSHYITSHHITSPPLWGLLVLAWDKWSAQMVHQCTKVYGIWAKMSCHIMSPPISATTEGTDLI